MKIQKVDAGPVEYHATEDGTAFRMDADTIEACLAQAAETYRDGIVPLRLVDRGNVVLTEAGLTHEIRARHSALMLYDALVVAARAAELGVGANGHCVEDDRIVFRFKSTTRQHEVSVRKDELLRQDTDALAVSVFQQIHEEVQP